MSLHIVIESTHLVLPDLRLRLRVSQDSVIPHLVKNEFIGRYSKVGSMEGH